MEDPDFDALLVIAATGTPDEFEAALDARIARLASRLDAIEERTGRRFFVPVLKPTLH